MADFQYGGGTGTPSIAELTALVRSSGLPFTISSSYRPGDPGYHGSQNAIDIVSSPDTMKQIARYLMQYQAYELELIHSGDPGYFVKNGKVVSAAFYGPDTVSGHYDHVHLAGTLAGMQAASQGDQVVADGSVLPGAKKGCLSSPAAVIPALLIAAPTLGAVFEWLSR